MEFHEKITSFVSENPGKSLGALIGFVLGILVLVFGVLKVFVIGFFIIIGILAGKMIDDKSSVMDRIMNIFKRR